MSWWDIIPTIATAIALLTLPGLALSAALDVRGALAFGLAPVFSVAMAGVSAVLLSLLGIPWSLASFLLTAAVFLVLAVLVKRLVFRGAWAQVSFRVDSRTVLGASAGLVLGGVSSAYNLVRIFDHPGNIAQRYDNVYHLNAVRWVLEQGDASTLTLGRLLNPDAEFALYPAAWHGLAALIAGAAGQPVPVAINALNLVIASVVWPIGVMLLARVVFGPRAVLIAIAGLFSAGFAAFPIGLLDFGPLYPNLLSYAILPAALALVVLILDVGPRDATHRGVIVLAFVAALAALVLAQPNGFTALLALAVPIGAFRWWRWMASATARKGLRGALLPLLAAGVAVGVFIAIWQALLIGYNTWLPFTRYASAIGQALTSAPHNRSIPVVIAVCTVAGILLLARRGRHLWLLGVFTVAVALYAISAAEPRGTLRVVATGSWYQDPQRLASLLPLPTVLIAAFGAACILTWLWQGLLRLSPTPPRGLQVVAGVVVAVVGVLGGLESQRGAIDEMVLTSREHHAWEGEGTILSLDELALLERLDDTVPEDAVIGVNPWNGGALAYAISGRSVTQYHMSSGPLPEDIGILAQEIDDATADSEACAVAREDNVEFVLDFGDYYLLDHPQAKLYPAFDDITDASALELVDSEGEARLYRVSSCF
ncbi:hypothetical protein PTW37_11015 [Arthrobacter agilis]|uniref:DUF6541 family protein n=1 Tax=Arthrobacter agilis TaxID=37921 RepID=UPI0023650156|nr:DUF6541 family protein [Arthrobacter agilis]WDF32398.1 hypothetical protein PTW37_11015 [Arthrobacter agilis]